MAGMDLKLSRSDRGMSVFWMILILGAGVFLIVALVLLAASRTGYDVGGDGAGIPVESIGVEETGASGATVIVGEDVGTADDVVGEGDVSIRTGDGIDGPDGTTEQALDEREEAIDVERTDEQAEGPAADPASTEAQSGLGVDERAIDLPEEERLQGGGDGVTVEDLDQSDIVVDPDGTTPPVDPLEAGPEGNDDNPLTMD